MKLDIQTVVSFLLLAFAMGGSYAALTYADSAVKDDVQNIEEDIDKLEEAQLDQITTNAAVAIDIVSIKKDQEYIKGQIQEQRQDAKDTLQILRSLKSAN